MTVSDHAGPRPGAVAPHDESGPDQGLKGSIQVPLNAIGRYFS